MDKHCDLCGERLHFDIRLCDKCETIEKIEAKHAADLYRAVEAERHALIRRFQEEAKAANSTTGVERSACVRTWRAAMDIVRARGGKT